PTIRSIPCRRNERLLEGHTTQSLLEAAAVNGGDRMLAALFRRRPEAVRAALTLLRKNGPQRRITDALGSAGSPAAVLDDDGDVQVRSAARLTSGALARAGRREHPEEAEAIDA